MHDACDGRCFCDWKNSLTPNKLKTWIEICEFSAQKLSTCGKRQYMSVILDKRGRVVSMGYNGGPSGMPHCKDGYCPRFQKNTPSGQSYDDCISVHAEENALIMADPARMAGGILIVNGHPCFGCAKKIANSGVEVVAFVRDKSYAGWDKTEEFLLKSNIRLFYWTKEADSFLPTEQTI